MIQRAEVIMGTVCHSNAIAVAAAIIAGATLGAASAAQADGMDRGPQAAYVRPFTWTGFYVGGNVGYGWGDNNRVRDLDGYNPNGNFRIGDTDGAAFGLQAGYNQQFQRIVVGIEGDGGFLGLTGAGQFPPFIGVRSPTDSAATVDMDYYGTITGRLGFTAGERLLIYGKAGWGWVRARASFTDSDTTGGTTLVSGLERNRTLDGGVWGGGLEYALSDWFSLKVEYLHFDISDTLTHIARSNTGSSFRFAHDIEDFDTVKVGFNIKFNRDVAPMK
jgi:outer membrane immunogenic protein